jgi:hypothetical protein
MEAPQTAEPPRNLPPMWRQAIDNPWLMLVMLFFVTAALGLPFLWISRGFSKPAKIVLSALVLLYTVLILWAFVAFMSWWWTNMIAPYL